RRVPLLPPAGPAEKPAVRGKADAGERAAHAGIEAGVLYRYLPRAAYAADPDPHAAGAADAPAAGPPRGAGQPAGDAPPPRAEHDGNDQPGAQTAQAGNRGARTAGGGE